MSGKTFFFREIILDGWLKFRAFNYSAPPEKKSVSMSSEHLVGAEKVSPPAPTI